MKKFLFVFSYSLYLFFLLGFFLHTSAHPQVFGKYTVKYVLILSALVLSFPLFLWLLYFVGKRTILTYRKEKLIITPLHKIVIYIFVIFLVLVLPTELFLRDKYKNYESNTYEYTIDNFHPFLQFQLAENFTSPVNAYRFRSEEITKQKPKGTYRIFVLGGSTVLNRGVTYEKNSVRLLELTLRKRYPNKTIEVINAGVDAYTSEHSLIQYLFNIKDFDPDMIIMWHGINDLVYSCSPQERSYGSFQSDYSHYLSADAQMALNHFKPAPLLSVKLVSYDFFVTFMRDNWYSDLLHAYKEKKQARGYYSGQLNNKTYDMNKYPSLPSYKRNLISLINSTKSDGVALILGNQPSLYDSKMGNEELGKIFFPVLHCSKEGKYPSLQSMTKGMKLYNETTRNIAKENDIPFVDLDSQIPRTVQYFTDDVHFTEKGNKKVGDVLADFIISNEFITNE